MRLTGLIELKWHINMHGVAKMVLRCSIRNNKLCGVTKTAFPSLCARRGLSIIINVRSYSYQGVWNRKMLITTRGESRRASRAVIRVVLPFETIGCGMSTTVLDHDWLVAT